MLGDEEIASDRGTERGVGDLYRGPLTSVKTAGGRIPETTGRVGTLMVALLTDVS